jgi:hypothetical protein
MVKVAGSIAASDKAILQSTEFAANATIARPVKPIVRILGMAWQPKDQMNEISYQRGMKVVITSTEPTMAAVPAAAKKSMSATQ